MPRPTVHLRLRRRGRDARGLADRVGAGERGVALLMGDPNVSGYQFLGKVERAVDGPVRVVPGISSIQVAASRARTPMEDTTFQTLHVRGDVTGRWTAWPTTQASAT